MMQKIDYGDINKFLVSIGIVLIGLAILTPYFYLKEDFGLLIEKETIIKYEEPIQELIRNKQEQVVSIQKMIPATSIILAVIGLTSAVIGLCRWFKRQSKIDEKFDKELEKLNLEIVSLTPEEKEEKTKQEVQEIELAEKLETPQSNVESTNESILKYIKIEEDIYKVFKNLNTPNFEIYSEQKLGNRFYIDLLLKAKSSKYADRIIEIKYFRNSLPITNLQKAIHQLNTYVSYYKANSNRKAVVPVLLIVYKQERLASDKIEIYKNRIIDFASDIPSMKRLKIEFIEEKSINEFDAKRVLMK